MIKLSVKTSNILALLLLAWGTTAMLGEAFKMSSLKGIGLASCAAPYTKVFCQAKSQQDGRPFETFAADFIIHYELNDSEKHHIKITPEIYQKLKGPYQRKNVYGAVLAYGPALPQELQQNTLSYALDSPGSIAKEIGIPEAARNIQVEVISKSRGSSDSWTLKGKQP